MSDRRLPPSANVVLGIVDGLHDAGAAVVLDGRLVAAANEERFTRRKLQGGMPTESIRAVLETAGVAAADVDVVAVGGMATPTVGTRLFRPAQAWFAPSLGICFDRPWHPLDRLGDLLRYRLGVSRARPGATAGRIERALAAPVVRRGLPPRLRDRPLAFVDHHLAHAESAWRTAGPGRWLVVTCDAHGDGRSLTVAVGDSARADVRLAPVRSFGVNASLGAFYSLVTKRLGFVPGRDEGKVLGLAASGDAARVPLEFPFRWSGKALAYTGAWGLAARAWFDALAGVSREDVAAWVQRGTERILLDGLARWLAETGASRVALAGGVFANVRLNGRIGALPGVEAVHVFPHMGDGGLAAGAALHVAGAPGRARPGLPRSRAVGPRVRTRRPGLGPSRRPPGGPRRRARRPPRPWAARRAVRGGHGVRAPGARAPVDPLSRRPTGGVGRAERRAPARRLHALRPDPARGGGGGRLPEPRIAPSSRPLHDGRRAGDRRVPPGLPRRGPRRRDGAPASGLPCRGPRVARPPLRAPGAHGAPGPRQHVLQHAPGADRGVAARRGPVVPREPAADDALGLLVLDRPPRGDRSVSA